MRWSRSGAYRSRRESEHCSLLHFLEAGHRHPTGQLNGGLRPPIFLREPLMYLPTAYDSTNALLESALNALPTVDEELIGTQEARTRAELEQLIRGCRVQITVRKRTMARRGLRE